MAEAFALAASIIGVIGFTLQLWTDTAEIRKGGSTVSVADCRKEAASLQAHCDRVKRLQNTEVNFAEAERIKQIATETRETAEELARRLAKCELPANQNGWRRYRDVIIVVWHGMRMDADAQMKRLNVLRDEIQSEILVSLSRKVDLSDLRNSQGFQKLDDDVQVLTTAMLEGQGSIEKAINSLDLTSRKRHEEVMAQLRRLGTTSKTPGRLLEDSVDEIKRERQVLVSELKERLWFSAMSRRHYAITAAHKKTFEWIFTGQKKTTESNTTLMEWMLGGSGLYWLSGRAGTGKSSLMRFLDDDNRTKEAFETWAGQRPLVFVAFYFWNSEAAGDDRLKSLAGLYQGILFSLINQDDAFAEILFPDDFVVGRDWDQNFPTLTDMAQAFGRLSTADSLPAAVGLIIDGLDEYEASSTDQMAMAEILCHAAKSSHLKIIVSSRPEAAFETVFAGSTKLRLHELTLGDRRTYASDKLKAVPRFETIIPEKTEQSALIDLIVQRSEGIFLWVHLAVVTLIQEIGVSMDADRLKNVVNSIPSGNKELSRVFDHILRNRIPDEARLLGFRLIYTLHYGYSLHDKLIRWVEGPIPKHPITAILYSFFEDDMTRALNMPVAPIENHKAISRIELTSNLMRRYCAGLLELRAFAEDEGSGTSGDDLLTDPEVHYLHKDVAAYLDQQDTTAFLDKSLLPVKATLQVNLMKCIVCMMKLYNPRRDSKPLSHTTETWGIWTFTELVMRIARTAEEDDVRTTEILLDEVDRVMSKHHNILPLNPWAEDAEQVPTEPPPSLHWTQLFPIDSHHKRHGFSADRGSADGYHSNMMAFAIEQGLFRYIESKIRKDGPKAVKKAGLPLLSSACGVEPIWYLLEDSIRPETVKLLLDNGADPNEAFNGVTCWQSALNTARFYGGRSLHEYTQLGHIMELMLNAGADPHAALTWTERTRLSRRNWVTEEHSLTTEQQIQITFLDIEAVEPQRYKLRAAYILLPEDSLRIMEIGGLLLQLVRDKATSTNKRKFWGTKVLHRRHWKDSLSERFGRGKRHGSSN